MARRNSSNGRKFLIAGCALLSVILAGSLILLGILSHKENTITKNVRDSFTVEVGSIQVDPAVFLVEPSDLPVTLLTEITPEQLMTPGSYPVTLSWQERLFSAMLLVADTTAPTATAVSASALLKAPDPATLVSDIQDFSEVIITYVNEPDMSKAGTFPVTVRLTDAYGNYSDITSQLTVILDTTAPTIQGVKSMVVYLGDAASYRAGITVTDDYDEAPKLTVDSSNVSLDKVGTYPVSYTATDASGNTSTLETTIRVMEKQASAVPIETINAAVDKVLDSIIKDGMTKKQQVTAIYNWARSKCSYYGHSDKSDYMQGAYVMLTQRKGDCFNYYAVTKLMFDRLGIDNIDVRKVKNHNGDSDHYWSLVSLDNGETWYHFDATPRVGSGDDFCLVTDAFLDAYSDAHDKCHNRDKSLYPTTPSK